jgi:hypothetical protein
MLLSFLFHECSAMTDSTHCPLCNATASQPFFADARRTYLRCIVCALVFVPPEYHLSAADERAEYDKHENDVEDQGYRKFLSRLFTPLNEMLAEASQGLDFGCGPGPALAAMFREAGHTVALYDTFYAPDSSVLNGSYDFISATEVVEHLYLPGHELSRLWCILCAGGTLGVMTKLVLDQEAFSRWHYKNDPTHVCFFSRETWQWWAGRSGASIRFIGSDVMLLTKPV